jgi:hypothetical protein
MRLCWCPSRRKIWRRRRTVFQVVSSPDDKRVSTSKSLAPRTVRESDHDRYAKEAPAEFKDFIEQKQKANKELLEVLTGSADVSHPHPPGYLYLTVGQTNTDTPNSKRPRRSTSTQVRSFGRTLGWSFEVSSPRRSTRPQDLLQVVTPLRR